MELKKITVKLTADAKAWLVSYGGDPSRAVRLLIERAGGPPDSVGGRGMAAIPAEKRSEEATRRANMPRKSKKSRRHKSLPA